MQIETQSLNETLLLFTPVSRVRSPEDESGLCSSLVELLERESQSEVFLEGISYALFKMAERGLVYAAEILLRYGADLNFEGKCALNTLCRLCEVTKHLKWV